MSDCSWAGPAILTTEFMGIVEFYVLEQFLAFLLFYSIIYLYFMVLFCGLDELFLA